MWRPRLTEHVATLILATKAISNVRLDPERDQSEVLDGVCSRVDATDEAEALAMVDIVAQCFELSAKGGQWERLGVDQVAIESQSCRSVSKVAELEEREVIYPYDGPRPRRSR